MNLQPLLAPRSVAIVGASEQADKIGGRPIRYMREFGFEGRILPVNPTRTTVQGLEAFPSVADLPEAPDAAIVAVAGEAAVAAVEACAAKGVRACVVMASGFGETGAAGKAIEARMCDVARAAGMRLVGPNTQGLANFGNGAILCFSTMFIEAPPADGRVACISQSGAMSVVPYGLLRARGIGVRHVHSTGNDADVTVSELTDAVLDDPDVALVLLYLETLTDPLMLARAAAKARARGVPIVALKGGRSEAGQAAAASHTGAIATPDRIVDAFFTQHGIWRAETVQDLVRAAELYLQPWRSSGNRLAIVSNSGATCVLAADAAARAFMPLASLAELTRERLRSVLPAFAATRNPIDITAALLGNSGLFSEVLPVVGADSEVDLVMVGIPVSGQGYDYPRFAADTAAFARTSGKGVVAAIPQDRIRAAFAAEGVASFVTEDEAIEALAQVTAHRTAMAGARGGTVAFAPPQGTARVLDEHQSLEMLARHGLATVERRLCTRAAEAVAFHEAVGGPIVLKPCAADLPHKTETGLVALGLDRPEAIEAAFRRIERGLEEQGIRDGAVLAACQQRSERELVVGGYLDPVFGPVVMVGDGGVLVEAVPDNALILAPFDEPAIEAAIRGLRIGPLFAGVRGRPPLAMAAVVRAARAVGALLLEGGVVSVDVNPLLVTAAGAIAVDALVESVAPDGSFARGGGT